MGSFIDLLIGWLVGAFVGDGEKAPRWLRAIDAIVVLILLIALGVWLWRVLS